jgi:hypothetical protein
VLLTRVGEHCSCLILSKLDYKGNRLDFEIIPKKKYNEKPETVCGSRIGGQTKFMDKRMTILSKLRTMPPQLNLLPDGEKGG